MNFVIGWVVVGLVAGWAMGKLMAGSGYGATLDIVVGILGAMIGGYMLRIPEFGGFGGLVYSMVVATIGACVLVVLFRLMGGRRPAL
jgi:uncharacterized membrane protein YeaQ/YmgE (transglycosylase-associated protein family)